MKALGRLAVFLASIALVVDATACAKLHARSEPQGPPLETPPPPARTIVPADSDPVVAAAPTPPETPARRATPDPPRAAAPPPRVETTPATPPSQPAADAAAPRTLQTTVNASEAEQRVRALLANAARDLGRIDARTLSNDAKAQYDIAKRFSEQAEEALKDKNVVFAGQLADKAAALAALLVRR